MIASPQPYDKLKCTEHPELAVTGEGSDDEHSTPLAARAILALDARHSPALETLPEVAGRSEDGQGLGGETPVGEASPEAVPAAQPAEAAEDSVEGAVAELPESRPAHGPSLTQAPEAGRSDAAVQPAPAAKPEKRTLWSRMGGLFGLWAAPGSDDGKGMASQVARADLGQAAQQPEPDAKLSAHSEGTGEDAGLDKEAVSTIPGHLPLGNDQDLSAPGKPATSLKRKNEAEAPSAQPGKRVRGTPLQKSMAVVYEYFRLEPPSA